MTASPSRSAEGVGRLSAEESREILVGLAAVAGFAVMLALSSLSSGHDRTSGYRLWATFSRIDGLSIGDIVQAAGIPIGKVEAVRLSENFRARVALRISDDVRLPVDTSAAVHTDGLFGRKFIELEPGGEEEMLADDGSINFTQGSLVVGELLDLIIAEGRGQRATGNTSSGDSGSGQ